MSGPGRRGERGVVRLTLLTSLSDSALPGHGASTASNSGQTETRSEVHRFCYASSLMSYDIKTWLKAPGSRGYFLLLCHYGIRLDSTLHEKNLNSIRAQVRPRPILSPADLSHLTCVRALLLRHAAQHVTLDRLTLSFVKPQEILNIIRDYSRLPLTFPLT